ncbi:bifunctional diaminohydroxyphosphoribosylaminopyrimidine deaminase/5-amino-6-(5-phosphoribosylamino)uracil reductase RibD [candidate division KSB1 bacterium]|nr:bifunctional diaminohydroxyphosphoribosylaminopyrimidine deaminase/5-amino-6-(5-phosphoribosylamino)uracil reductase RibD [candidate division KSB1 bacterium]
MEDKSVHIQFMQRALQLAARGEKAVRPNPMVGAVIVKNGDIIAEGFHERFGYNHAELNALIIAGTEAKGSTLYVNLEPCCHQGKTPPCTDAIIKAGVSTVVIGMSDPNPKVAGKGIEILKRHGISVITDVETDACCGLNHVFIKYISLGLPYVTMKIAQSLDGRIATESGHSKWITGTAARAQVHQIRCDNDAVLVGIGTVLADNPRLTIRHLAGKQPRRIVLDSQLQTPLNSNLLTDAHASQTIIATTRPNSIALSKIQKMGITIWRMEADDFGGVALAPLLHRLAEERISTLLVEGGASIFTSFLRERLVDRLVIMMAPKIIGRGTDAIGSLHIEKVDKSYQLKHVNVRKLCEDIVVEGDVVYP